MNKSIEVVHWILIGVCKKYGGDKVEFLKKSTNYAESIKALFPVCPDCDKNGKQALILAIHSY